MFLPLQRLYCSYFFFSACCYERCMSECSLSLLEGFPNAPQSSVHSIDYYLDGIWDCLVEVLNGLWVNSLLVWVPLKWPRDSGITSAVIRFPVKKQYGNARSLSSSLFSMGIVPAKAAPASLRVWKVVQDGSCCNYGFTAWMWQHECGSMRETMLSSLMVLVSSSYRHRLLPNKEFTASKDVTQHTKHKQYMCSD